MSIKLDFERLYKYIAKDDSGEIFVYEELPIKLKNRWDNDTNSDADEAPLIILPMPWDKSLHKLIRDKDGFVVDLEPCIPDPREELKVDDKVWVWAKEGGEKYPRHFCSYEKEGTGIYVFLEGRSSFTENRNGHHWKYWEKA